MDFKNGLLLYFKQYDENGNLIAERHYQYDDKGNPIEEKIEDGLHQEYYPSGNLKVEYHTKDGQYDGLMKRYYENGRLQFISDFKDGRNVGLWKKYFEDGVLQKTCNTQDLENGETRKDYQEFDEQGKLIREFYEILIKQDSGKTLIKKYKNAKLVNETLWQDGKIINEKGYDELGE
jgi:antitoxin component YwqK of YwqJK toxin-antitoxin module